MPQAARDDEPDNARIVLGLLQSVERDGAQSQRKLASDLGIALGLVNAYLKRCVKKGLLKIGQAPARRYAYYLTPHGFAEKSRLTVEYLSDVVFVLPPCPRGLRRRAAGGACARLQSRRPCRRLGPGRDRHDLRAGTGHRHRRGGRRKSASRQIRRYTGGEIARRGAGGCDAVLVTDLQATREFVAALAEEIGAERVLVPALLGHSSRSPTESAA